MEIDQIVGFIVTLLAIIFLIVKPIYDGLYKKRHPKEHAEKEAAREKALSDFLKSLKGDMKEKFEDDEQEEEEELRPILRRPVETRRKTPDDFRYETKYEEYKPKTNIYDQKIAIERRKPLGTEVVSGDMRMRDPVHAYDIVEAHPSRAKVLLKKLKSPKEMVILHEIISKPKGLR